MLFYLIGAMGVQVTIQKAQSQITAVLTVKVGAVVPSVPHGKVVNLMAIRFTLCFLYLPSYSSGPQFECIYFWPAKTCHAGKFLLMRLLCLVFLKKKKKKKKHTLNNNILASIEKRNFRLWCLVHSIINLHCLLIVIHISKVQLGARRSLGDDP